MASFNNDDDDISLCSTTWTEFRSDYGEGQDYTVDRVLAEDRDEDSQLRYLLKWSGYSNDRASWMEEEDVPTECIQVWLEQQDRVRAGQAKPFNVRQWARAVEQEKERKQVRKERRATKRKRLGITTKYRPGHRPPLADSIVEKAANDNLFEPERVLTKEKPPNKTQPVPSAPSKASSSITTSSKPKSSSASAPNLGQSTTKKTTVAPTARKPVNIFSNWSAKTQPKKRGSMSAKSGTTNDISAGTKAARPLLLSHVHRINKAAANEPAPLSYEAVLAAGEAPSTKRTSSVGGTSTSAPDQPAPAQGPSVPEPDYRSKIRKTCWFWANGGCMKSDRDCRFVHASDFELSHPPSSWMARPQQPAQHFPQPLQPMVANPVLASPPVTPIVEKPPVIVNRPVQTMTPSPKPIKVRLSSQVLDQVDVELHTDSPSIAQLLMSTRGPEPHLSINFSMTEQAYTIFKLSQPLSSVSIHYGDVSFVRGGRNNESKKTVQTSADQSSLAQRNHAETKTRIDQIQRDDALRKFCIGLEEQAIKLNCEATASVIVHKAWALLLYHPSKAACFSDGVTTATDTQELRFQLIAPLQALRDPPTVNVVDDHDNNKQVVFVTYIYQMFAGLFPEDIDDMFKWHTGQSLERRVFLRFEGHSQERDLMTMLLESAGVTVTNSDTPNAWEDFIKRALRPGQAGTGVVVFHPANRQFHRVHQLWLLMNSRINFYIVGPCTDDFWRGYDTFETVQVWKPFVDGTATLIVDDLFENHPERAYRVVEYIVKKAENKPFDKRTWKLFARPRVLDWLLDLVENHKNDGAGHARAHLVNAIWDRLCPMETRLSPELADPAQIATLIGPTPLEYERHCENFKARPPWEREMLFFAMWALDMCFSFRRFVVVVPVVTPEHEAFKSKWGHIDVLTPEKYLERYNR